MKKILFISAATAALALLNVSCDSIDKDAHLFAHKTAECFSLLYDMQETADYESTAYDLCEAEADKMHKEFEEKYSEGDRTQEFTRLYYKYLKEENLPEEALEAIEFMSDINEMGLVNLFAEDEDDEANEE